MSTHRTIDSKGRISLGERFANRPAIIEDRGDEFIVRIARVIPESESWLYRNPKALASVRRGLEQARAGKLSARGPDLAKARKLAKRTSGPGE